ncbi:MAG: hypothetical protein LBM20_00880 [Rikenellaceae bacterium]|jgi:hypothetical protein|nr:hypothetical protein [Rikenellaceae bacterium]
MKNVKRIVRETVKRDVCAGWKRGIVAATMMLMAATVGVQAQDKAEVSVGADLVSSYVWRGVYQTGVSFQPGMSLDWKGFSVGAWGSTDFDSFKEFDLSLGYSIGGLSLGVTDYWWSGQGAPYFAHPGSSHLIEGTVAYTFGESFPLTASWSTFFAGADKKADGKQQYSTYIELSYPFTLGGVDMSMAVGAAPWLSPAWLPVDKEGFQVANISLTAAKELYSLPMFVQVAANPATDDVHLVVGISF